MNTKRGDYACLSVQSLQAETLLVWTKLVFFTVAYIFKLVKQKLF
jgi:hypothetical protein